MVVVGAVEVGVGVCDDGEADGWGACVSTVTGLGAGAVEVVVGELDPVVGTVVVDVLADDATSVVGAVSANAAVESPTTEIPPTRTAADAAKSLFMMPPVEVVLT